MTALFASGTEAPPGVGREAVLDEGVLLHEPNPLSFSSCRGSRFCLSGVEVAGEVVGIDIGRRWQKKALKRRAGDEEPVPGGYYGICRE